MNYSNPFRIHGTVTGPYFADRTEEIVRIRATLLEAGAKLLVYGRRRMGKTSTMQMAITEVEEAGGSAFLADLSTATTIVDMSNRILDAAARTLGRRWRDIASDLIQRIGVSLSVSPDQATGLIVPSIDIGLRRADLEDQRRTLGQVLDAIEQLAESRDITLGVVLDEFQEIHRFGGEEAEWHLRGVIQNHRHVAYVLAGSQEHLIRRMLGKTRAFYGLVDRMNLGPMDPVVLGSWIDDRLSENGVPASGVGTECILVAGPGTRDVIQLARKTFDLASSGGVVGEETVEDAFLEVVEEEDELVRTMWESLTAHQQNVLRAVAGSTEGLTTATTIEQYSLGDTGTVVNAAKSLIADGILLKVEGGSGYAFDSPFFRGWVVVNALPDLGLRVAPTFRTENPPRITQASEV